ncbi:hypothetical protein [Amycolatopsis jejuensis]|nr:hypothetical protein [Amycolatopsis jejuensis]
MIDDPADGWIPESVAAAYDRPGGTIGGNRVRLGRPHHQRHG